MSDGIQPVERVQPAESIEPIKPIEPIERIEPHSMYHTLKIAQMNKLLDDDVVEVVNCATSAVHYICIGNIESERIRKTLEFAVKVAFTGFDHYTDTPLPLVASHEFASCFYFDQNVLVFMCGDRADANLNLWNVYTWLLEELGSDMPTREDIDERGVSSQLDLYDDQTILSDAAKMRASEWEESDASVVFEEDLAETLCNECSTDDRVVKFNKQRLRAIFVKKPRIRVVVGFSL